MRQADRMSALPGRQAFGSVGLPCVGPLAFNTPVRGNTRLDVAALSVGARGRGFDIGAEYGQTGTIVSAGGASGLFRTSSDSPAKDGGLFRIARWAAEAESTRLASGVGDATGIRFEAQLHRVADGRASQLVR